MHVVYGVGSWGLGHATRSVPLIRGLLDAGCRVTVVSSGRALAVLRDELRTSRGEPKGVRGEPASPCTFLDWPDVPQPLGRTAAAFYLKAAVAVPWFFAAIADEHRRLRALLRQQRVDRIVSDNRYGIFDASVPSYHVAHSLRFIAPARMRFIELALEYFNHRWFAPLRVRRILVPDDESPGLSGDLAHNLVFFGPPRLVYLGIVTEVRRLEVPEDLDAFVTLSGPEPQRTLLERIVLKQVVGLRGRVAVALGRPESRAVRQIGSATVYDYLPRRTQEEFLNRSRVVVARAGYTTIMELAVVRKRAALVPTPGQTEQVHLAAYHARQGTAHAVPQSRLNLARDIELAGRTAGLRARSTTDQAVARFLDVVLG